MNSSEVEACVNAEALAHVPPRELVFYKQRVSREQFDTISRCTMSGHIVV